MIQVHQLVVFTLDEQRYAVPLSAVERIVRLVEITPVPHTPEIILGVINVQGRILPVVNIRRRFRLPARELHPSDHLLIARTSKRTVALVVDAVSEVITLSRSFSISDSFSFTCVAIRSVMISESFRYPPSVARPIRIPAIQSIRVSES